MFGFLKTAVNPSVTHIGGFKGSQIDFLVSADYAYIMTFKQLDMSHFAKYSTRALYMKIYSSITLERPWAGVSDKFKNTTWTFLEVLGKDGFKAKKEVVFDKVNVSKQLKISVADDYVELWIVSTKSSGDLVVDSIVQQ